MTRDYRDLVIEELADSEAALQADNSCLRREVAVWRWIARGAIHALHESDRRFRWERAARRRSAGERSELQRAA